MLGNRDSDRKTGRDINIEVLFERGTELYEVKKQGAGVPESSGEGVEEGAQVAQWTLRAGAGVWEWQWWAGVSNAGPRSLPVAGQWRILYGLECGWCQPTTTELSRVRGIGLD